MTFRKSVQSSLVLSLASVASLVSCGDDSPYRERKAKCKLNCDKGDDGRGGKTDDAKPKEGYLRAGLELGTDAQFWLNNTPLSKLENGEAAQLLVSNPFVSVATTDPSYGGLGTSISKALDVLASRARMAANVTEENRAENPTAKCFSDALRKPASVQGSNLGFTITPGLCFQLDAVTRSIQGAKQALVYEDTMAFHVPADQDSFSLSGSQSGGFSLAQLTGDTNQVGLPFVHSNENLIGRFSFQNLQMQGFVKESGDLPFELTWNFIALGNNKQDLFEINHDAANQEWSLTGSFTEVVGITNDSQAIRLQNAQSQGGYARKIQFDDFRIKNANSLGGAFRKSTGAIFEGSFVVSLMQPGGALNFTLEGTGEACFVEIFTGTSGSESLGKLDLCIQGE